MFLLSLLHRSVCNRMTSGRRSAEQTSLLLLQLPQLGVDGITTVLDIPAALAQLLLLFLLALTFQTPFFLFLLLLAYAALSGPLFFLFSPRLLLTTGILPLLHHMTSVRRRKRGRRGGTDLSARGDDLLAKALTKHEDGGEMDLSMT